MPTNATRLGRESKDFSVGKGRDFPRERHDVVVAGHVLHGEVFSAVAHEHVALVFNSSGLRGCRGCSEFLDVGVAHVHTLLSVWRQTMQVSRDGKRSMVFSNCSAPLFHFGRDLIEHLLVGGIHRDVEWVGSGQFLRAP